MLRKILIIWLLLSFSLPILCAEKKNKVNKVHLTIDADTFYDPNVDYSHFSGRVTDRDATGSILKVASETKNVRFFHAGDFIEFKIQTQGKTESCNSYVRSIEENYFVIYVKDIEPCFTNTEYFRRGTVLLMYSEKLAQRVKEASIYRASLILKKKDYMQQLNHINQNIWNFEERKIQLAAEYDRKIIEAEKDKMRAIGELLSKKNDEIRLQKELISRLDSVDKEFIFYRIEKDDLMFDRWHLDHDLSVPVYDQPEALRPKAEHLVN
jgi:hypothetical protein